MMKHKTLTELVESYINGNISYVKNKVKHMSKREWLAFMEIANEYGQDQVQIIKLLL